MCEPNNSGVRQCQQDHQMSARCNCVEPVNFFVCNLRNVMRGVRWLLLWLSLTTCCTTRYNSWPRRPSRAMHLSAEACAHQQFFHVHIRLTTSGGFTTSATNVRPLVNWNLALPHQQTSLLHSLSLTIFIAMNRRTHETAVPSCSQHRFVISKIPIRPLVRHSCPPSCSLPPPVSTSPSSLASAFFFVVYNWNMPHLTQT